MIAFFLFWAAFARAAGPGPGSGLALHDVGPGEAQIYAAFLEQNFKPSKNDGPLARGVIILENESRDLWQKNRRAWEAFLTKRVSGPGRASDGCMDAFLRRPQQILRYFNFPQTRHALRLVRSDELQKHLEKGWSDFYDAYSGAQGVISFGAIGFGSDGNEALFTVHSQCGLRCGYRDLVYMQKIDGTWRVILKEALP